MMVAWPLLLTALLTMPSRIERPIPMKSCRSSVILERQWSKSYSEVDRLLRSAAREEVVNMDYLQEHVSTLSTISGIDADLTEFGYLPDATLRKTMNNWSLWRPHLHDTLCAPLRKRTIEEGCIGQRRFARLWLADTRALDRMLVEMEIGTPVPMEKVKRLVEFFEKVTGIRGEGLPDVRLDVMGQLKLGASTSLWQEWFAANIGKMCAPAAKP